MGLKDFKKAPDNKGGRPKKEEQDKEEQIQQRGPGYEIDPLTRDKDSALYFEDLWAEFVSGDAPTKEEISDMAARACVLSITLKLKLAEYDIWESDDLEELVWTGGSSSSSSSSKGALFGSGSDSSEESSGLASLINDAN